VGQSERGGGDAFQAKKAYSDTVGTRVTELQGIPSQRKVNLNSEKVVN